MHGAIPSLPLSVGPATPSNRLHPPIPQRYIVQWYGLPYQDAIETGFLDPRGDLAGPAALSLRVLLLQWCSCQATDDFSSTIGFAVTTVRTRAARRAGRDSNRKESLFRQSIRDPSFGLLDGNPDTPPAEIRLGRTFLYAPFRFGLRELVQIIGVCRVRIAYQCIPIRGVARIVVRMRADCVTSTDSRHQISDPVSFPPDFLLFLRASEVVRDTSTIDVEVVMVALLRCPGNSATPALQRSSDSVFLLSF